MMKKSVLLVLATILVVALMGTSAFAMTEEEILAAVAANEGNYEMGGPLTKDDFTVYTRDERIEKYESDILLEMAASGNAWWNFWGSTQKSIELFGDNEDFSISYTYRGIIIEDRVQHSSLCDKESVLSRYGTGLEGNFDPSRDVVYQYKKNKGDDISKLSIELMGECETWLLYNYKDAGQIKFYFDSDGQICYTSIFKGIQETADKETTESIQEYLNENGYDCGTPDGIAGKKTKAALAQFQEDHGLFASGYIDDSLMRYLAEQ